MITDINKYSKAVPSSAIDEAKKHPNSYLYKIDNKYDLSFGVPPCAIVGAWKVDENGNIIGEFIFNKNYIPFG